MPDASGALDLSQVANKEQAPESKGPIVAKTAYLVMVMETGEVAVTPDLDTYVVTERQPTVAEIYQTSATIMKDIEKEETAILTAQHVLNAQMQLGRQIAEAQQNQAIMQQMPNLRS